MRKLIWLTAGSVVIAFVIIFFSSDTDPLGLPAQAGGKEKPLKRQEIIKSSHKYHLVELELTCDACHKNAATSEVSADKLLPGHDGCSDCHAVDDEEQCVTCHFEDAETRVALEPTDREIVFSHKFHIEQAGMACETCHKNLKEVDFANAESAPTMTDCNACHNNQQATLECVACHTNPLNLRPADHTSDFLVIHKNIARIDQQDCAVCHTDNDCSECHEGGSLLFTTTSGAVDVQSPKYASNMGTRALVLPRVHELNFRFTHPLQATGRTGECAVCHDTQSFCQDCHESQGVDVAGKPLWHGGPDWGALAGVVGTGGGRHAELAKRDIESCAGCHSTEGDDPTCLLCHTDFDGVRGTNPKTHASSFANRFDSGSDFHTDASAVCYSCHTSSNQAGVGFCSYCHGPR
jgi:hypothetical protein